VPAKAVLAKQGVEVAGTQDYLHLYPHRHDTDGFFAAVLERRKGA
jgi:16S rRNA (cytosine967-C5)-methyltransferase